MLITFKLNRTYTLLQLQFASTVNCVQEESKIIAILVVKWSNQLL